MSLDTIARQRLFEGTQHLTTMLGFNHVDKVDDDDTAQITQPQLARHRLGRLEIRLEQCLFQILAAHIGASIDVDGGQGLGLVEHQVAAGFEQHLTLQRFFYFVLDRVKVEDRPVARIVFDAVFEFRHIGAREFKRLLMGLARVDTHLLDAAHHQIAHAAQRQGQIFVQQTGPRGLNGRVQRRPGAAQISDIVLQVHVGYGARQSAQDITTLVAFLHCRSHHLSQALAFDIVLDLLGDADVFGVRHVHQVARRQGDVRGKTRALGAERILDHLHDQFLTVVQEFADARRRLGCLGAAVCGIPTAHR